MKDLSFFFLIAMTFASLDLSGQGSLTAGESYCNPLNLSYRFCLDTPSRREAADPALVVFKNEYYLFASKSGGYWHSTDLANWDFITSADLPFEDYAPAVVVLNGYIYFMASGSHPHIYRTADPRSGKWDIANASFPIGMTDPDLFMDDDGKLYFYYGCSNKDPIYGVELDTQTLSPIGKPVACFNSHKDRYGWERPGDYNEKPEAPWIEGAWMTKRKGTYYLQYAAPGTQFKSYCDGVYTSVGPLGPFTLAANNPCSYKPEGFIAGAGHSSTFRDIYGNYWHISTMTISVKHMFERRIGLFPMFFDRDGELYTYTGFGDFPIVIPRKKINGPADLLRPSKLLSYHKPMEASSSIPNHPVTYASDEDIRTYWSAASGNKGEWIRLDLRKECVLSSVQINFAENGTYLAGRSPGIYYQYLLEYSNDNKIWKTLVNKTSNLTDIPHDYVVLDKPVKGRYIRLTNYHVPDGTFALSDLRVFGTGPGQLPRKDLRLQVRRNKADRCLVRLEWSKDKAATGYNIRYGTARDKLYQNYEVLNADSLTIRSLDSTQPYYFTIDSFNEKGVREGTSTIEVK